MDVIRLGIFSPSVLIDVARSTGRLADAGVEVALTRVPSSPAQFAALRDRALDAAFTSPDNVIAYRFLTGNPLGQRLDLEILAGLDRGLGLCLAGRPGLDRPADLRGRQFGVDVPASGFAFAGYALLARLGLGRADYRITTLGATPRRLTSLLAGGCDATVLNAGSELLARAAGCALLATAGELGPYLGTVVTRLADGARADAVDRLTAALIDTAAAICSGGLRAEAQRSATALISPSPEIAAEHVAVLLDQSTGLIPDGAVDPAALANLVGLRRDALPDPQLDAVLPSLGEFVRESALSR